MSSSTSSSPTTSSSSPIHSSTQGVNIPTTTVVGIGAGFVCFALSILSVLLLIRFIRLALNARRENIPVRQAWNDQGGFWGWLHGVGSRDRDHSIDRLRRMEELERAGFWTGGGGWYSSEIARMRLWNEMRREGLKLKEDVGERPEIWEVALGEGKPDMADTEWNEEEKVFEAYRPLSIGPTRIPTSSVSPEPIIRLSLLIALPAPEVTNPKRSLLGADEFPDLPDMVMGSTYFTPTMSSSPFGPSGSDARLPTTIPSGEKGDLKGEVEVAHLEYGIAPTQGSRTANWTKRGDKWVIEGLEDCMSTGISGN